jgi:hypothetical protein
LSIDAPVLSSVTRPAIEPRRFSGKSRLSFSSPSTTAIGVALSRHP